MSCKRVCGWLCAVLMIAATSASLAAQGGSTASSIIGTVTDTSGGVIPGAEVVVKNNATGIEFNAVTNEQGGFTIPAVDPGTYTVTVTLMGFKTAVLNKVVVNAATPTSVRARLEVGGLEETVVVSGGSEIIQTQSAAVTTTAHSGMSTSRLNQSIATPSPIAEPLVRFVDPPDRRPRAGRECATAAVVTAPCPMPRSPW